MMYDYKLHLTIRTPRACPWEQSVLANGLAGNPEITEKNEDYEAFKAALHVVNETLAKKIAGDGEGCTALFEVKIVGAESKELGSKSSGNQWKRRWTAEM